MIFLSVTGSFAAAVIYDRREKKKAQKKWCDLVAHVAQHPLDIKTMPRKLTVFISGPPGDSIRVSRDYFKEYIKPILVAAAMDYDIIEGRKEGDVRYGTAEQIRRFRRTKGERGDRPVAEEPDTEQIVSALREKAGIRSEPGVRGDLVIGRHTWKEYIRGLHEGWLGPLDEPLPPPAAPAAEPPVHIIPPDEAPPLQDTKTDGTGNDDNPLETAEEAKKKEEEKKPPFPPASYLSIPAYSASPLTSTIPQTLEPSAPLPQPHLLGFLKTPIRIYRFLNRRHLADDIGRQTAAIVLAASRPYTQSESFASTSSRETTSDLDASPANLATRTPENNVAAVVQTSQTWEQQVVLQEEEPTWHKSIRKPTKDDSERVWLDGVVLDVRIAERMRKFELDPAEEDRARRIGEGKEKGRAREMDDLRSVEVKLPDGED